MRAEWDNELTQVERELKHLEAAHRRNTLTGQKELIARKVAVIQLQINFERNLHRIMRVTDREYFLFPRELAVLHWGRVYCEKAQEWFSKWMELSSRSLWLKLVQTRLSDGHRSTQDDPDQLGAEDLVELSVRHENLDKTEHYLKKRLRDLQKRNQDLHKEAACLDVAYANKSASICLAGRLGTDVADALRSPPIKALEAYLMQITAPVTAAGRHRILKARERQSRFSEKALNLITGCRKIALSRLRHPDHVPSPKALGTFQSAMQQLRDLEEETLRAYEEIRQHATFGPQDSAKLSSVPDTAPTPPKHSTSLKFSQNQPKHAKTLPSA